MSGTLNYKKMEMERIHVLCMHLERMLTSIGLAAQEELRETATLAGMDRMDLYCDKQAHKRKLQVCWHVFHIHVEEILNK